MERRVHLEPAGIVRLVEDDAESDWWVVLFSPHAEPLDLTTGLPIGRRIDISYSDQDLGLVHADLDGDGLEDLVDDWQYSDWILDDVSKVPPELLEAGEIRIWFGADLLAAEEARLAALGLD